MKILILGGTGAMGRPLVKLLNKKKKSDIFVTSRSVHKDYDNVHFIQGNAQDDVTFVKSILLKNHYDVLIDFMVYESKILAQRLNLYLEHTDQYIFFSSSRVYASSRSPLIESSPRLLDVCQDQEYLSTDEYALAKAREEDLLIQNKKKNWTIIRPYITYNSNRLQLGVYEKENWLYRALKGKPVVFPKDIANKYTNLTFGPDVARNLVNLIGNEAAYGEIFHIVNNESIKWRDVAEVYDKVINQVTGKHLNIKYVDNSQGLQTVWNPWQIKYDRLFDRRFNSGKIITLTGMSSYVPVEEGLTKCLTNFLADPQWLAYRMNWGYEGWSDKQTHSLTNIFEINGKRNKLRYLKHRF